jgi:hypothetical protein
VLYMRGLSVLCKPTQAASFPYALSVSFTTSFWDILHSASCVLHFPFFPLHRRRRDLCVFFYPSMTAAITGIFTDNIELLINDFLHVANFVSFFYRNKSSIQQGVRSKSSHLDHDSTDVIARDYMYFEYIWRAA